MEDLPAEDKGKSENEGGKNIVAKYGRRPESAVEMAQLKVAYVTGEYSSVRSVAEARGVDVHWLEKCAVAEGWTKERRDYVKTMGRTLAGRITKDATESALRRIKLSQKLQQKGLEGIKDANMVTDSTPAQSAMVLSMGLDAERKEENSILAFYRHAFAMFIDELHAVDYCERCRGQVGEAVKRFREEIADSDGKAEAEEG